MTNHAGQQLKGIFEGSPGPAMEDVEVEKQSSQSPRSRSESSMSEAASPNSQKSRVLYCRKCEGHGVQAILKGHAPTCPYNLCNCKSCEKLMTKRMHSFNKRNKGRLEAAAALTATRNRLRAEALANNLDPDEADLQLSNQPHLLRALLAGSPNGDSNDVRDYDNNLGQPGTSKSGDSLRLDEMSGSSPSFNPNEMNVMSYEIWMSKFNNKKKTSSASTRSESSAATASSIGSLASAASSSAASRKRSYDFIKNIDIKRESGAVFPGPKEKSGGAESDDGDFVTLPTIPPVRCKIRRQDDAMLAQQKPGWTESKESVNAEAQSAVHVICQPIPTFGTSTVPPLTMEHRSSQLPRTLPPSSLSGPTLGSFGIPTTPGVPQSAIARPSVVSHSLMPQLHPTFTTSSGNSVASGIPTPLTSGVVGSPIISATTPPSNQSAMEHLQNEVHFLKNYCQELQKQLHLQNQQTPAPPAFLPIASHLQFSSPSPVLRPMASAIPSSNQQYMDLMQQQLLMNSLGLCPKDFLDTLPGASANDKLGLAPMLNDGASLQSFVNQLSSLAVLAPAQTPIM